MEITTRQHERMLTCAILLEEACEKNPLALRAVRLIREELDDITVEECELEDLIGLPELPAPSDKPGKSDQTAIRAYGKELLESGCTLRELITLVIEHFGLTQTGFADLIGVNEGSLSHYLNSGYRRQAVLAGVTGFFGDGKDGE